MVLRGPDTRLAGLSVILIVALTACGSDPPAERQSAERQSAERQSDSRRTDGATASTVSAPVPVARELVPPAELPLALAVPLDNPPPAAAASASPTSIASYPPSDECAKVPGFAAFRVTLFAAVAKRDAAALAGLANPAVNLDFGGGSGPDELRKRLESTPALWGELAALEGLGCAEDGGVVTLPWIFSRMPDPLDPYTALLVTGKGVPLRAKPATDAKELAKLDWTLVEATKTPGAGAFREVNSGKLRGYVETARLRSVIGYRLIADRQNDEWKVTAFVAGD